MRLKDAKHCRFIRSLPCAYQGAHGLQCSGDVVPAHIRMGAKAGTGRKPDDSRVIPLCHAHHSLQHDKGELFFHGNKLRESIELAIQLYKVTGNREKAIEAIVRFR